MKTALQDNGYEVVAVESGAKAIKEIRKEFYPLIILDVKLPDTDGLAVLKMLRELQKESLHSVVIMVTGFPSEEIVVEAIKNGANDYLAKPFNLTEFSYSVNRNAKVAELEIEKYEYARQLAQKNKELGETLLELKKAKDTADNCNITLERMVEEEMRSFQISQAQLIQSAKMAAVGQLGAGVAHELNNPLTAVLGYSQFLLQKTKDKGPLDINDLRSYLESIEKETIRCREIVSNLLQFSRKPFGEKDEPIDIRKAIDSVFLIIGNQLKLNNIEVEAKLAPDLFKVAGNLNQLAQVFINIFLNARDAMKGKGKLSINVQNIIDEKNNNACTVAVAISDTGCGIAQENLAKIFEPFFTTKEKDIGTGLGLFVTYQIIQEHNGSIEVKSEVGKGTTFTITLPAAQ
jgi:two-component system NtrC family sensor kinase